LEFRPVDLEETQNSKETSDGLEIRSTREEETLQWLDMKPATAYDVHDGF
jgi:hypothetical protein